MWASRTSRNRRPRRDGRLGGTTWRRSGNRRLRVESLENRQLLSAAPVDVLGIAPPDEAAVEGSREAGADTAALNVAEGVSDRGNPHASPVDWQIAGPEYDFSPLPDSLELPQIDIQPQIWQCFGVYLVGNELRIYGTSGADTVSVIPVDGCDWNLSVIFNGRPYHFNPVSVEKIVFHGRDGDDVFRNETGIRAVAYGGNGDDMLVGGKAGDELRGGYGDDKLYGREGNDFLYGGEGNDKLFGDRYEDGHIPDSPGSTGWVDVLYGDGGCDWLYGDCGNDILIGGIDTDVYFGGDGSDFIIANEECGDFIHGDSEDTVFKDSYDVVFW